MARGKVRIDGFFYVGWGGVCVWVSDDNRAFSDLGGKSAMADLELERKGFNMVITNNDDQCSKGIRCSIKETIKKKLLNTGLSEFNETQEPDQVILTNPLINKRENL